MANKRHFNSIKVQLEPDPGRQQHQPVEFQFHKGTIRTELVFTESNGYYSNFNSIKVQLELSAANSFILEIPYFNSIKVQLERGRS